MSNDSHPTPPLNGATVLNGDRHKRAVNIIKMAQALIGQAQELDDVVVICRGRADEKGARTLSVMSTNTTPELPSYLLSEALARLHAPR